MFGLGHVHRKDLFGKLQREKRMHSKVLGISPKLEEQIYPRF